MKKWMIVGLYFFLFLFLSGIIIIKEPFGLNIFKGISLLLFYIYPACSLIIGIIAGFHIKELWKIILILPICYLFITIIIFHIDEFVIIGISFVYLVISLISMLLVHGIKIKIFKKKE